jgi:hypothetical protein
MVNLTVEGRERSRADGKVAPSEKRKEGEEDA